MTGSLKKLPRFWAASLPERRLAGKRPERVARLIRPSTPNGQGLGALARLLALASLVAAGGCAGSAHGGALGAGSTDVHFASGNLWLKGTVQVPDGPGRHPAVVLVHGSGPQSRDSAMAGQLAMSFGCSIELWDELADGLEDAGFVVLRYDKRTCGPFNDCADNGYPWPSVTHVIDDLVDDAAAGARWLSRQAVVDPARIYVVGHSEGGQLVPRLLTDVAELRGGVMLAAPFNSIDAVLEGQVKFVEALIKAKGEAVDEAQAKVLAGLHEQVAALHALRQGSYKGATIAHVPVVYWRSWLKAGDEAPALAAATPKPLLALSGDYDWNVPPEETQAWQQTFALEPKPGHETEVLSCVTHAMSCVRQPNPAQIRRDDIDCVIDQRVIERVVKFLKAH